MFDSLDSLHYCLQHVYLSHRKSSDIIFKENLSTDLLDFSLICSQINFVCVIIFFFVGWRSVYFWPGKLWTAWAQLQQ